MLIRTHLALIVLFIILFLPHVQNQYLFVGVALAASFIPDIDNAFSTLGSRGVFRALQFFTKHRGMIHSLTIAVLISIILAVFFPAASLAFFLGYGLHIFLDSFTKEGVAPFWPWKKVSSGFIRTGGKIEMSLFVFLILADIAVFILVYVL